jgi:hypothetical protein
VPVPDQTECKALSLVFNLQIGLGFIFEPCSSFLISQ